MSQLEFLDIASSQPWYQELSGGRNARNVASSAPPAPPSTPAPWGRIHREVWKVNDTVFVKGLGRQVHSKMKTKTDSFLGLPAQFPIPPAHARMSAFQARMLRAPGSVKGKKPLIRKREEKNVLGSQKMECSTSLPSSDLALRLHHPDFVPCRLTCLCGRRGDLPWGFAPYFV